MAHIAELKQSTATTLLLGPFLDDTDGKTAETGLTLSQADILLWKEGGTTLAQKNESTSATHRSNGLYTCPIDTTDTNTLGVLDVSVAESGALPIRQSYNVITADEWNRKYAITGAVMTFGIKARGTTVSCTATGAVLAAAETLPDNIVRGDIIALEYSAGNWVSAVITASALSGDTVTFDTMVPAPTGAIRYVILASAPSSAAELAAIGNAATESAITAIKTYSRSDNNNATITGPTSGSNALSILTDPTFEPVKTF